MDDPEEPERVFARDHSQAMLRSNSLPDHHPGARLSFSSIFCAAMPACEPATLQVEHAFTPSLARR
jgi:hypothetical protein